MGNQLKIRHYHFRFLKKLDGNDFQEKQPLSRKDMRHYCHVNLNNGSRHTDADGLGSTMANQIKDSIDGQMVINQMGIMAVMNVGIKSKWRMECCSKHGRGTAMEYNGNQLRCYNCRGLSYLAGTAQSDLRVEEEGGREDEVGCCLS
ncbi:hypothetical protein Tco_0776944 [Tanacetum coccineum]